MSVAMRIWAASALAAPALLGVAAPRAAAQARVINGQVVVPGQPIFTPAVANQQVNPGFYLRPGLTIAQAAFNTRVAGSALRSIPPYAFGFNPYPRVTYGPNFPNLYPYAGMPYLGAYPYGGVYAPGYLYGGVAPAYAMTAMNPYGGAASTPGYEGGSSLTTPVMPGAAPNGSGGVSGAKLVNPATPPLLVSASRPARPDSTKDVWIYDSSFSPATLLVKAGTTVRWINYGFGQHTVTAQDGSFDSGTISRGGEFSLTFDKPGVYAYFCRFHPQHMVGTVTVTK